MSTILSQKNFIPCNYSELDTDNKSYLSTTYYQNCIDWYDKLSDAEFFDIIYLSDDLEIKGIIAKPKVINGTHPVIIYNRGGHNDFGKITVCTLKQIFYFWTQQGYVVLASQYRGTKESQGVDELGGADVHDILSIINIAQTMPYVDSKNIFMIGHSRGALMSLIAIRHIHTIKALALTGAVTDLFSLEQLRPDLIPLFHQIIPGMPDNKHAEYIKRSATHWADEINTPTLIMHGDSDTVIDISQSLSLEKELKKYNKKYKLIVYPKGSHSLIGHQSSINKEILAWFKNH